jgi:hypothetical protein
VLGRYKMGKHSQLTMEEDRFDRQRKPASIERKAALDGVFVIRTSVPPGHYDIDFSRIMPNDLAGGTPF